MSFKTAIKVIEQLPRLVVLIPGFHPLSKYPWNSHYGLWISCCLTFLEISSLQIKIPGEIRRFWSLFSGTLIFWGVHEIPALFLGNGKKGLGICYTNQPPVFSIYTWPFLTTW